MFANATKPPRPSPAASAPPKIETGAVPLFFGDEDATCFGFFHGATGASRSTAVLLCLPLGYEGTCSFETFTALAERLTAEGFDVLRFDYHGTGDSPGSDGDPGRLMAWRASVRAAASELRRLSRARQLVVMGLRFGATLALLESAAAEVRADGAVLWAPCISGRTYTRELKVAAIAHEKDERDPDARDIESLGFLYTGDTLDELAKVDLLKQAPPVLKRVLLIGRDGQTSEGPLGEHLRNTTELSFVAADGLLDIMRDSHQRVVPQMVVSEIVSWLVEHAPRAPALVSEPSFVRASAEFGAVRETPIHFGVNDGLFGVLSEPRSEPEGQPATAIIMLNIGTNHRVGPNRLYVKMARRWAEAGFMTLRFDLAGMGDSRAAAGYTTGRLYSKASTVDVQAAIDDLARRGAQQFVLVGLCSGAYVAFQSALLDRRVVAQVLLNPRRLSFSAGDTLESVMAESYKSSRYYGRALFSLQTYLRLARGQVDVRGIAGRMGSLVLAHGRRVGDRLTGRRPPEEDVLSNVRLLCRRGVQSLFVVGEEDDGLDYLEFHLGSRGRAVRSARFRMEFIPGSDHTFSRAVSQERVIGLVSGYLATRLSRSDSPSHVRASLRT